MKKLIAILSYTVVTAALATVLFLLLFPLFAHAKEGRGRPTPAELTVREEQRQILLKAKDRLHLAMARGTAEDVADVWNRTPAATGLQWDARDHYAYGRYLVRKNKASEANKYFQIALYPPPNIRTDLPRKGERVITLAPTTQDAAPAHRRVDWDKLLAMAKPIADLKGDAEDEYIYGEEFLLAGESELAATHFRRSVALNPNSAFAHENLGDILRNLGRDEEGKDQFVSAYRLTKRWARASLRSKLRVMQVDVDQIEKQSSPSITSKADGQSRSAKNVSTVEQSP